MHLMSHFADKMSELIDKGSKVTHEKLAEQVEAQTESPKLWQNYKHKVRRSRLL